MTFAPAAVGAILLRVHLPAHGDRPPDMRKDDARTGFADLGYSGPPRLERALAEIVTTISLPTAPPRH